MTEKQKKLLMRWTMVITLVVALFYGYWYLIAEKTLPTYEMKITSQIKYTIPYKIEALRWLRDIVSILIWVPLLFLLGFKLENAEQQIGLVIGLIIFGPFIGLMVCSQYSLSNILLFSPLLILAFYVIIALVSFLTIVLPEAIDNEDTKEENELALNSNFGMAMGFGPGLGLAIGLKHGLDIGLVFNIVLAVYLLAIVGIIAALVKAVKVTGNYLLVRT